MEGGPRKTRGYIGTEESRGDIERRKKRVCGNCAYHVTLGGLNYCDHLGITGKRRPCPGAECVEKGIYKPIRKRAKYRGDISRTNDISYGRKTDSEKLRPDEKSFDQLTKAQQYYRLHKEEIKAKYQAERADRVKRTREWKRNNPDKVAEYNRKRREKRRLERLAREEASESNTDTQP